LNSKCVFINYRWTAPFSLSMRNIEVLHHGAYVEFLFYFINEQSSYSSDRFSAYCSDRNGHVIWALRARWTTLTSRWIVVYSLEMYFSAILMAKRNYEFIALTSSRTALFKNVTFHFLNSFARINLHLYLAEVFTNNFVDYFELS